MACNRLAWVGLVLLGGWAVSVPAGLRAEEAEGRQGVALAWYQPDFWQSIDGQPVLESWEFDEAEVRLIKPRGGRGSLISQPVPEHFELSFQWKIGPKANNGIKYRVRQYGSRWLGLEYQMLDEPIPLAQPSIGSTASIYDLVAPSLDKPLHPAGQWNDARIVARGNRVEHYLNGALVASAATSGPAWQATIARSKFYGLEGFGESRSGDRIMLTDHGGAAAYRNFKLVELPPPADAGDRAPPTPQLADGVRSGWVGPTSIMVWTGTTAAEGAPHGSTQSAESAAPTTVRLPDGSELELALQTAAAPGEVRLTYFPGTKRNLAVTTPWTATTAERSFTHYWLLEGLQPGTPYHFIVEARPVGESELTAVVRETVSTARAKAARAE